MFGLIRKRSSLIRLYRKYKQLVSDSQRLSSSNMQLSEQLALEASGILHQIEILRSRD